MEQGQAEVTLALSEPDLTVLEPVKNTDIVLILDAALCFQDRDRQQAQIGIMVEFAIAMMGKLDGINRHSFNSFRLRVGECLAAAI